MILTDEQQAVIDCKEHCLVLASAGSGKTSTIAEKIKHIKENEINKRVLYITFTRKAKQHAIEKLGHYNGVVVNNYHGLAYFIIGLNKAFFKINTVDIVNDSYCIKVLKSICKTNKDAIAVLKEIVNIKYHEIPYKEIKDDRLRSCYNHLEQVLEKQKKFTYADLIVKTNNLLKNNEFNMGTRRYLYFDYIFVDEFQDNYPGEYSLVLNLLKFSPNCKLTLIGDVVQSVYSFLGAVPELCLEFIDKMNPKLLPLSKNFRSQENIIKFSNDILADVKHFKELITPMSATIPPGDVPKFYYHDEAENEYYWVCKEIKHLVYSGYKYSDIAILFRFNRSGVEFDKMALSNSIPFELDRGSLINRKAILSVMTLVSFIQMAQDPLVNEESLLSYLEMFYGEVEDDINTKSLELVAKTYKEMPFLTKLAKIEMLKIKGLGQVKKVALYKFYKKIESMIALDLSNFSSINKIIDFVWDFKFVRKGSVQYHDSIREDFNILLDILGHTPGETLMDKINYLKVDFTQADNDEGVRNKVRGLTVHKAKGLEFKVVFYIQFDNDTLLSQMIANNDMHRLDQRLEEEKRVIYVGCTRAMEKLYLTSSRSSGFKTHLIATSPNLSMDDSVRRVYKQFDADLGD